MTKAVFLDKDGTLVEDVPYSVETPRLKPTAAEALKLLRAAGFLLVLVTNQSGIARGLFAPGQLMAHLNELEDMLGGLDGVYFCSHLGGCECRKPEPGMLLRAIDELGIDLAQSWMVGDKETDEAAGRSAGCRTVLLGDATLLEAAKMIVGTT